MSALEIAFYLLQPSNALLLLLAASLGLALFAPRVGLCAAAAATLLIAVCGLLPVGAVLIAQLEDRHPFAGIVEPPDGIIVLGGFLDTEGSLIHNQIQLNDYAERITAAASLARRFPAAKVIVTDGAPKGASTSGAELSKVMLVDFGVDEARIVREHEAQSTWDNARFSHALVEPKAGERYVIVTSAFHMPRAMATFAAAGWTGLVAWPVDYAADRPAWRAFPGSVSRGLKLVDQAAREYAALLLYSLTGRMADPRGGT